MLTIPRVRLEAGPPPGIRKAILLPKPQGAIDDLSDRLESFDCAHWVLEYIAQHGNIINDGRRLPEAAWFSYTGQWLLVPVMPDMIDALALVGAERSDLEPNGDREPDVDAELSIGATDAVGQRKAWADHDPPAGFDRQADDVHDEDGGYREPEESDDDLIDEPSLGATTTDQRDAWSAQLGGSSLTDAELDSSDDEDDGKTEPSNTRPQGLKGKLPVFATADEPSKRLMPTHPTLGTFRRL
jgi:hypothetical protein